jgi:phosphinothricin acetyltransferase
VLLAFIFSHNLPSIKLFNRFDYKVWGELPEIAIMDDKAYGLTILGKHLQP